MQAEMRKEDYENEPKAMEQVEEEISKENGEYRYKNPLYSGEYRNKPCPCYSGEKVKKCHGSVRSLTLEQYNKFQMELSGVENA